MQLVARRGESEHDARRGLGCFALQHVNDSRAAFVGQQELPGITAGEPIFLYIPYPISYICLYSRYIILYILHACNKCPHSIYPVLRSVPPSENKVNRFSGCLPIISGKAILGLT